MTSPTTTPHSTPLQRAHAASTVVLEAARRVRAALWHLCRQEREGNLSLAIATEVGVRALAALPRATAFLERLAANLNALRTRNAER